MKKMMMVLCALCLVLGAGCGTGRGIAPSTKHQAPSTKCNPLVLPDVPAGLWCRGVPNGSVPDKPLWRVARTEQYRELADPTLLVEDGEYWLYASGGEAWRSKDAAGVLTRLAAIEFDIGGCTPACCLPSLRDLPRLRRRRGA